LIDRVEIRARARQLGLDESHIENDYVLCHVLVAVSEAFPELVFRGGTALARVYWPDYRLSEDLDFTSEDAVTELENRLRDVIRVARERTTLSLELNFGQPQGSWSRSTVGWNDHALLVDVNMGVEVALGHSHAQINLPYRDLGENTATIEVFSLQEILGNKWYMLNGRTEPRDLFDVWSGLIQFDVPFEDISRGHLARYGYAPSPGSLHNARRLDTLWETRLAHQLSDLPPFAQVYRDVTREFEAWRKQQQAQ
jgi:uncharacterized protein